ncbi:MULTISPECIES: hypothetical protein [unclassified Chryseobacterium]|uniref:hypothetical protein n=1 Tax=unclassified Chryseobacterium TaxID=2593645 RepID=UPI00301745F6
MENNTEKIKKILLEAHYIKETFRNIDFKNENVKEIKKQVKKVEQAYLQLEKELSVIFNVSIDNNTKKIFIKLKEGDFSKDLLDVAKYLE